MKQRLVAGMLMALSLAALPAAGGDPHADYFGAVDEAQPLLRLERPLDYSLLDGEQGLLTVLGGALDAGLITGYDLRRKGVYDDMVPGRTFIYSHNSPLHIQQLIVMMAAHGVDADVYVTPKVSAFLFRDGWGTPGAGVSTLPGGVAVVKGREFAVLFDFADATAKHQFHALVQRYAKKDAEDETGLIADAWWQPFYYSDQPFQGFDQIALAVVSSDCCEATLTLPLERAARVVDYFMAQGHAVRRDDVWVNPAFYRFLHGDYK